MPGGHPLKLTLPIPTAISNRPMALGITAEPLFAEHGDKRGEEGDGQTREKDCLGVDDGGVGASPYCLVKGNTEVG